MVSRSSSRRKTKKIARKKGERKESNVQKGAGRKKKVKEREGVCKAKDKGEMLRNKTYRSSRLLTSTLKCVAQHRTSAL